MHRGSSCSDRSCSRSRAGEDELHSGLPDFTTSEAGEALQGDGVAESTAEAIRLPSRADENKHLQALISARDVQIAELQTQLRLCGHATDRVAPSVAEPGAAPAESVSSEVVSGVAESGWPRVILPIPIPSATAPSGTSGQDAGNSGTEVSPGRPLVSCDADATVLVPAASSVSDSPTMPIVVNMRPTSSASMPSTVHVPPLPLAVLPADGAPWDHLSDDELDVTRRHGRVADKQDREAAVPARSVLPRPVVVRVERLSEPGRVILSSESAERLPRAQRHPQQQHGYQARDLAHYPAALQVQHQVHHGLQPLVRQGPPATPQQAQQRLQQRQLQCAATPRYSVCSHASGPRSVTPTPLAIRRDPSSSPSPGVRQPLQGQIWSAAVGPVAMLPPNRGPVLMIGPRQVHATPRSDTAPPWLCRAGLPSVGAVGISPPQPLQTPMLARRLLPAPGSVTVSPCLAARPFMWQQGSLPATAA